MTAPEKKLDDSSTIIDGSSQLRGMPRNCTQPVAACLRSSLARSRPPTIAWDRGLRLLRLTLQARHASNLQSVVAFILRRLLRLTVQARHASPAPNPVVFPEESARPIYSSFRLLCLGFTVLALFACERSVGKPPAAPPANVIRPVVYVPADLDLVLRLDVSRFRQTMGVDPEQSLEKMWEAFGEPSSAPSQNSMWLVPALRSTDTLWLGCRLGVKGCKDFVFVLRGRFASARETYGFGQEKNKRDLGAGWFSYDFASSGRAAAARLYWRPPELAVVVSSAEIDSAERSVEHSQDTTRLEPSETGLMSLSGRSKALAVVLRERSPKAADWLSKSERIELRFEPLSGFDNRIKAGDIDVEHLNSDVVLRISFPTAEQTFRESTIEDNAP